MKTTILIPLFIMIFASLYGYNNNMTLHLFNAVQDTTNLECQTLLEKQIKLTEKYKQQVLDLKAVADELREVAEQLRDEAEQQKNEAEKQKNICEELAIEVENEKQNALDLNDKYYEMKAEHEVEMEQQNDILETEKEMYNARNEELLNEIKALKEQLEKFEK